MEQNTGETKMPSSEAAGIYKDMINASLLKKLINLFLTELNPDNIPEMIHNIVWEDPDTFLQMIGTSSAFLNIVFTAVREIIRNVSEFQAPVLADTMSNVAKRLNVASVGESAGLAQMLITDMMLLSASNPEIAEAAGQMGRDVLRGYLEAFSSRGADAEQYTTELVRLALKTGIDTVSYMLRNLSKFQVSSVAAVASDLTDKLDIEMIGEAIALSQMLVTDFAVMTDSSEEVAQTAAKIATGISEGYKNAFIARGADPEEYTSSLFQVGMRTLSKMVSAINREMTKPDSIVKKLINEMIISMSAIFRDNPAIIKELMNLVFTMGQSIFPFSGGIMSPPPQQAPPQQAPPQQPPSA